MTFASTAFVPVQSLPSWLVAFARNQPVTHAVNTARELSLGLPSSGAWWKLLIWVAAILAAFVPLAVWRYKSRA